MSSLSITAGQDLIVPAGQTFFLDVPSPNLPPIHKLVVKGTLLFDCIPIVLHCDQIYVESGGVLRVGSSSQPAVNLARIELGGNINLNADDGLLRVEAGGTLELHGQPFIVNSGDVPWTQLAIDAKAGDTVINLATAVNWPAGKQIVIASTDFERTQTVTTSPPNQPMTEVCTISTVLSPQSLKLNQALAFDHFGSFVEGTVDERAEVGLLDRSIQIVGAGAVTTRAGFVDVDGPAAKCKVEWAEFKGLGWFAAEDHYPLYIDGLGDAAGSFVNNCSFHDNWHNGVVVSDTQNLSVSGNVAYNTLGYHFWLESTTSVGNVLSKNLALQALETPAHDNEDFDEDRAACFYVVKWNNTLEDNHAASSEKSGFYYRAPGELSSTPIPTSFARNVAHSCAYSGFYADDHPGWPLFTWPAPAAAHFNDFTAYKNTGFGIHERNFGTAVWTNVQLADNGGGIYFASAGEWDRELQGVQFLVGGRIVGESSTNLGRVDSTDEIAYGRSLPYHPDDGHLDATKELLGISLYDGFVTVQNVDFRNFNDTPNLPVRGVRKAGAFGPAVYESPWAMDPRNTAIGCTFTNARPVFFRTATLAADGVRNTTLYDFTGCIPTALGAGVPGTLITANNPRLVPLGGGLDAQFNALVLRPPTGTNPPSPATNPLATVILFQGDSTSANPLPNGRPKTVLVPASAGAGAPTETLAGAILRDNPVRYVMFAWNQQVSQAAPTSFIPLSFPAVTNMSATPVTIALMGNAPGSTIAFSIPYSASSAGNFGPSTFSGSTTNPSASNLTVTNCTSAAAVLTTAGNAFFYDKITGLLHVKLVLPAATNLIPFFGGTSIYDGGPVYLTFLP